MNLIHKNVLTGFECISIENAFFNAVKRGRINEDNNFCNTSYGFYSPFNNTQEFYSINENEICQRLTRLINYHYLENICYSHSYIRAYFNNSILPVHNDKEGLDITLSVNVGGLADWSIQISELEINYEFNETHPIDAASSKINLFKSKFNSYKTPRGSGMSCYGKRFPHWRDQLICKDNEYVLQIFFHWKIIH